MSSVHRQPQAPCSKSCTLPLHPTCRASVLFGAYQIIVLDNGGRRVSDRFAQSHFGEVERIGVVVSLMYIGHICHHAWNGSDFVCVKAQHTYSRHRVGVDVAVLLCWHRMHRKKSTPSYYRVDSLPVSNVDLCV